MGNKRFIMTQGLPGCGKSSWADQQVLNLPPGHGVIVNRDDLRKMINAGRWAGSKTEQHVTRTRDALIREAMRAETPLIISSDTNFYKPGCEDVFRALCDAHGYSFTIQDFTDVPLKTCIERDVARGKSAGVVGEKVIRDMHKRYLQKETVKLEQNESLSKAILVDIDGTLAHMQGRKPYDWARVGEDSFDATVGRIVELEFMAGTTIIIMSGRDGSCREQTEFWLAKHGVPYHELHMRAAGDSRKDSIVKRELFDAHVTDKYFVQYVLDDRDQVVEMWREMGLVCLQVAPGDF